MIWPFATREDGPNPGVSGQWRRIDQGQDLQARVGTAVLAVESGTIHYAHDPNGFGDPYPVLILDTPQPTYNGIYYGHQHPLVAEGTHVNQGDRIALASQSPGGDASHLPGWLEIGLWKGGPTGDGQAMHNLLLHVPVFQPPGDDDMPYTQWPVGDRQALVKDVAQAVAGNPEQPNVVNLGQVATLLKQILSWVKAIATKVGATPPTGG